MDTEHDCDSDKLIEEACQGSEQAFRALVECNQDQLFATMFRMLGCREDAEEAVQEAFVRAFLRIDDFKRKSKFSTWLYRIAFNSALSCSRKKRLQVSLDQAVEDYNGQAVDDRSEAVDTSLLRDEQIQLVHHALDKLSADHRAILVLREMDELAYEEISQVLGISVGTVRSRLSRARSSLRDVMEAILVNVNEWRA